MSQITQILSQIEKGDPIAHRQLLPLVYEELRRIAAAKMKREPAGHTLQATALVHEAYLRLLGSDQTVNWRNRKHFFAAAAEAMRRVLIESARKRKRLKRGGDREREEVDFAELPGLGPDDDVDVVNDALDRLADVEPKKAEIVKLRFFAGLTIEQTAELLDISTATVERHWSYARAWLFREVERARES